MIAVSLSHSLALFLSLALSCSLCWLLIRSILRSKALPYAVRSKQINWNMCIQLKWRSHLFLKKPLSLLCVLQYMAYRSVAADGILRICGVLWFVSCKVFGTILIISSLFFRYFIRWLLHSRLYFTNGWNIYCRCIKARKLNTGVFRWRLWIQQKKKQRSEQHKHCCTDDRSQMPNNLINAAQHNKQ